MIKLEEYDEIVIPECSKRDKIGMNKIEETQKEGEMEHTFGFLGILHDG